MSARARRTGRRLAPLALLLSALGCGAAAPLPDPDPGLMGLSLEDIQPPLILPGSDLVIRGAGFPGPGDGAASLRLQGRFLPATGGARELDVRLRAIYDDARRLRVPATADLFAALGAIEGRIEADAAVVIDSAVDLRKYETAPRPVRIDVRRVLVPRLTSVDLAGAAQGTGRVHPNDWIVARGDSLLLGGGEGRTVAVLSGCFLPEGVTGECSLAGQRVVNVEVEARPAASAGDTFDRTAVVFPYSPRIHGIRPGRFSGTVSLKNEQPGGGDTRSAPRPLQLTQLRPEVRAFSPAAASLGQYVEIRGAGFIGGAPGQATLVRLSGVYVPEGETRMAPVDLDMVVEWVPRFPDGPIGRYVLDENDALGRALEAGGGLRRAAGRFSGTATPILRLGKDSVSGDPAPVTLQLLHVKQVVVVSFLPSYLDTLRLLGLRAVDNAVRARVLEVARRDYAGVNIEFREAGAPVTDFALYSQVDISGADPNGLGFLGYDNTPGRDVQNGRLYDRIGGVNAVTQSDGSPGYGGIFAEQFIGFSAHPGRVEKLQVPEADSALFDRIFDRVRPEVGGTPAQVAEVARLPALGDGSACPAPEEDRPRHVACAVFVLGSLIGSTLTHEVGHSLGLANPSSMGGSYHDNGQVPGRLMNPGGQRPFAERAEIGRPPAVFCDTEYDYLRLVLKGAADAPPPVTRPPCLE